MKKAGFFKFFRAVAVIVIAVAVALVLYNIRPRAKRQIPEDAGLLVETLTVEPEKVRMLIEAFGTVKPREELKLVAEVRGRIVNIDKAFKEGGRIQGGKSLIQIDPRTYSLEVDRRKAQIDQVDADLQRLGQEIQNIETSISIARSDSNLAKAEFYRLKELARRNVVAQTTLDKAEQNFLSSANRLQSLKNQLALTGPSGDQLRSQRKLLQVSLKQAAIDLERTLISAPFDGWVQSRAVEVGQHVNIGEFLGNVYREGAYDVDVRIPLKELQWLTSGFTRKTAPLADVFLENQEIPHKWRGRLARTKAQIDEKTRTLTAVVEIDETPDFHRASTLLGLRPGIFVRVQIEGKPMENIFVLPRYVVHAGDVVYLADGDRLQIRSVEVLRRFKDSVYVTKGLSSGERVIRTPIGGAMQGMKIRIK